MDGSQDLLTIWREATGANWPAMPALWEDPLPKKSTHYGGSTSAGVGSKLGLRPKIQRGSYQEFGGSNFQLQKFAALLFFHKNDHRLGKQWSSLSLVLNGPFINMNSFFNHVEPGWVFLNPTNDHSKNGTHTTPTPKSPQPLLRKSPWHSPLSASKRRVTPSAHAVRTCLHWHDDGRVCYVDLLV